MKKIVKLLPLVLALTVAIPTYAGTMQSTADTQSSEQQITLPAYFDIQKTDGTIETNATFQSDYSTITLDNALSTAFKVITNDAKAKVALSAQAGTISSTSGLYFTGSDLNIVFANVTNSGGSVAATEADIKKITTGTNKQQSPNCFALKLIPECHADTTFTNNAATADPVAAGELNDQGQLVYELKNGAYSMKYSTGITAADNTFNTFDTYGTYKATITLSKYSS